MSIAYIGIGSNLGDRQKNCEKAVKFLTELKGIKSLIKSTWYETEPLVSDRTVERSYGREVEQSKKYINGVVRIETNLPPEGLFKILQQIEAELGRVRTGKKWEPRVIDLDILFYDDLIVDTPELKIPHPEVHKRLFVLEPLCDIAGSLVHPVLNKTVKELLESLKQEAGNRKHDK